MRYADRWGAALVIAALIFVIACREARPHPAPEGLIDVPGGKVFYKTMGSGDRTPLLLLHGGPGGRSCGFSVLSDLATDRRVIRYDQLGTGQSDRPTDVNLWRTERFVDELDAVRKALGLREVLFLAGRHDEAAPETIADFQGRVPGARMVVFENSAHSTYRTETTEYVKIVRQFLNEAESGR